MSLFLFDGGIWELIKDFPKIADPWVIFFAKVAGILAVLIVPLTAAIHEHINNRRRWQKEDEDRRRQQQAMQQQIPPSVLSPIMSAFADTLTVDELRIELSEMSGRIAELVVLITILLGELKGRELDEK